jgi:hypothetical protein
MALLSGSLGLRLLCFCEGFGRFVALLLSSLVPKDWIRHSGMPMRQDIRCFFTSYADKKEVVEPFDAAQHNLEDWRDKHVTRSTG